MQTWLDELLTLNGRARNMLAIVSSAYCLHGPTEEPKPFTVPYLHEWELRSRCFSPPMLELAEDLVASTAGCVWLAMLAKESERHDDSKP